MPKPQKIIEQFCEPANKNTSNKSYSIISCGFSINLVHREIGDLAKDQRIARERRVTMGFRELRRYGVKFRIEIFRTLTGVILLSMGR